MAFDADVGSVSGVRVRFRSVTQGMGAAKLKSGQTPPDACSVQDLLTPCRFGTDAHLSCRTGVHITVGETVFLSSYYFLLAPRLL
ncbi:MAG TPA: hypothetical protein VFV34_10015, partial [Blastocatellia bacterium]|nr:hypothetical protein [Blastocatellia bacterium]